MDMSVNIAGVEWKNPVTVASGTFGSGAEFADYVDINKLGAVTTKGVANVPWVGNPTPRADLPSYKRKVWHEMKRLNPADYEERQLEDFSKYVFGISYQNLKDVMNQQKGREEQCRKQGYWWKREEQLTKKQYHTGSTCR